MLKIQYMDDFERIFYCPKCQSTDIKTDRYPLRGAKESIPFDEFLEYATHTPHPNQNGIILEMVERFEGHEIKCQKCGYTFSFTTEIKLKDASMVGCQVITRKE